jgi:hypothetical protein
MMAVHKVIRSNSPAQPQPQDENPRRLDHQLKAELFETLHHLNRGYGVALAALDRLEAKDRYTARVFPPGFLLDYRNRTLTLRARANHDLFRLLAGREADEAERFSRLCAKPVKRSQRPRPNRRSKP